MSSRETAQARFTHARVHAGKLPSVAALALAICALILNASEDAHATTSSTPLVVAAAVNVRCAIAVTPLSFGPYLAVANVDASTGIVVNCTPGGRRARIALGQGAHPALGSDPLVNPLRRMEGPTVGVDFLSYQLYSDAGRATVWTENPIVGPGAPQAYPKTWTVYGRVPAGQVVNAGVYTDTVVVTLDF